MNNQKKRILSFILSLTIYFLYLGFINFNDVFDGYRITVLLPLAFILCFHFLLWGPTTKIRSPYFIMYSMIAFVRFVILSILTIEGGIYYGISGVQVSSKNLTFAALLMMWELVSTSLFINYWSKKKIQINKNDKKRYYSKANMNFYLSFVLVSSLLLIVFPESRKGISFFGEISYALNDEFGSTFILGIREVFVNAKYFFLFFIISKLQKVNGIDFKKNKLLSYSFILLVVILTIGIRIGSNRKKMLSDAIAALLLLWNLFPKYKKTTTISVLLTGTLLVVGTTIYRGMTSSAADFFNSYFDLHTLQTYFLGQYNVGIAIEAKDMFMDSITIKSFVFGLLRPMFGVGSVIKDIDVTYLEELFDKRMSMGIVGFRGDQILPLIGQGYMFLGYLLAPIVSIIIARLGVFFDNIYLNSKSIEMLFISSLISFYLAQAMILNSTIIINMLTFRLAIFIPVFYLGVSMRRKKYYSSLLEHA